jgi:hypothetical protein
VLVKLCGTSFVPFVKLILGSAAAFLRMLGHWKRLLQARCAD